jgi:transcriptional regulator with XRE-family HTH domain
MTADPNYPDLASRIRRMLAVMEWNQSDLAREIGATPGAIGNWLHRNQQMDARYAFLLQDRYRWNARWIIEGIGPERLQVVDKEAEELYNRILSLPADRRKGLAILLGTE